LRVWVFRGVSDISKLSPGSYGLPVNGNFSCVDVVLQPRTLLQFTTGGYDPRIEGRIDNIRANLFADRKDHCLDFVVPKELFHTYSKQEGLETSRNT
jgi:hypothetical protein